MDHKDCPAAKIACFSCEIIGHMEKMCQNPKKWSASATNMSRRESCILSTKKHTEGPSRMTSQSEKGNQRGKSNLAQPKGVPHLVWNGSKFQRRPLDLPLSLMVEVTLMSEAHTELGYAANKLNSLCIYLNRHVHVQWYRVNISGNQQLTHHSQTHHIMYYQHPILISTKIVADYYTNPS